MKLGAWREREGLTQVELAARLGCSQATVSLLESGGRTLPRPSLMKRIVGLTEGAVVPADFYDLSNAA